MIRLPLLVLSAWLILPACTHLPPAPTTLAEDPGFKQETVDVPQGMEPSAPEPFRLRPGDVLSLRVISVTPFEVGRMSVDDTGVLYAPLVGGLQVGGMTLDQAASKLQEEMRRYDKFGVVSLSVVEAAGHQASVLGAVDKPGLYSLEGPMRISELLAKAGGMRTEIVERSAELIEYSDLEAARLLRKGEPLPVSVSRALLGDPRHNVQVQSGDVLYVPALQGAAIAIYGDVREPRPVPWRKGLRLSDAINWSGGLMQEADLGDIRIIRGPLSHPRVYRAKVSDFIKGEGADIELARGDIVYVTRHWYYTTTDVIQRLAPLLTVGSAAAVGITLSR